MKVEENGIKFWTPWQAKLLASTLCLGCVFALFTLAAWTVQLVGDFLGYFSSVLWPLAIASILAILLLPVVRSIEKRSGLSSRFSIALLYAIVFGTGSFAIWSIGGEVISQSRELASSSIDWPERIEEKIKESVSSETWGAVSQRFHQFKGEWKLGIQNLFQEVPELSGNSARVLKDAWSSVGSFFSSFACLVIVPIYLFYFLSSKGDPLGALSGHLTFINEDLRHDLIYLIRQFKEILEGFFRGQLIIGLVMGIGYAIGFSLCGLKFGIALGLFFGILNIIPFLGTGLGVLTVLAVSYLQPGGIFETGQWNVLWGCGITFLVVQLIESYWLSPKVMGERTGLHPVVIIVSVFFWGTAFDGLLGMILGIPLTAFLTVFWRLMRKKYLSS